MGAEESKRRLYESLVRQCADGLYRHAARLTGDPHVAEDLVQETFYEAWRSIGKLRDPEKARAWIYQILRHRYMHWLRSIKNHRRAPAPIEEMENELPPAAAAPEGEFSDRHELQKALNALGDLYKEPFLLVYAAGFTCREAAEALGAPLGTVLSRIHRARGFLKQFLSESGPSVNAVKTDAGDGFANSSKRGNRQ